MAQKEKNRIDFLLDFKKGDISALESLKKDIAEIQRMANDIDFIGVSDEKEIQSMVNAARTLDKALDQAFDVDLNTINIQKFNNILKQSGYNAETLQMDLSAAGATGQQAFLKMTGQLMQFNTVTKQTNHFLDGLATSFFNTVKWGIMSSILNNISGVVQKSYYYVKDLDSSLNDIRIVTGKSADEMERFAEKANDAAKALAVTTEDYTKGSLIYYQQGLNDETVKTLTDITAKTSNVTGQGMDTVSEQLTAVWNGYKVANQAAEEGMQVYEEYVDKMAAVGATTASDLEELSTAMSKVASAASAMGVTFDDLNAQIATIVSVTRQAPESVGTALKTIYARLGDLKVDGVDEFGVKLGEVTSQLQTMGINILDQQGNMRKMSTVMTEVAAKWDTWTSAQRQAAAVAMAGKRQYNNLIALFDNWDMYGEALETSLNAAGTLEKQQMIAMDSLANKMDVLKATAEDLYDSLFNTDTITDFVEAGTGILQFFADFTDAVGGLNNILPMLGSLGLQVFSEQIGRGISTVVINFQNALNQAQLMKNNFEQIKLMFSDAAIFNVGDITGQATAAQLQEIKGYYEKMYQYQSIMNEEQKKQYNNILNSKVEIGNSTVVLEEQLEYWKIINERTGLLNTELITSVEKSNELNLEAQNLKQAAEQIENKFNALDFKGKFNGKNLIGLKHEFNKLVEDIGLSSAQVDILKSKIKGLNSIDAVKDAVKKVVADMKSLGATSEEINKVRAKIDQLTNSTEVLDSALTNTLSTQQLWTNITGTVGALSQLAFSINTIRNIGNIFSQDDLSIAEKTTQLFMNLGFVLSSLTISFQAFQKTTVGANLLKAFTTQLDVINAKKIESIAIDNAQIAASKVKGIEQQNEVARLTALITEEEIETAVTNGQTAADVWANHVKEAQIHLEDESIAAIIANTKVRMSQTAATNAGTAANKAFNASLIGAHPVISALALLAVTIGAVALAYNDANKKQLNFAKDQIEKTKAIQEEIDANQKLYKEYSKTFDAYEQGNATKEELLTATESVCEAYGIEIDRLDVLTDKYQNLTKEINEARQAELKHAQENLARQKANQNISTFQTAREGAGRKVGSKYQVSFWDTLSLDGYDQTLATILKQNVSNEFNAAGALDYSVDYNNMDQMLQLYDELTEASNEYIDTVGEEKASQSDTFKNLNEWLNRVGPEVEEYRSTLEQLKETDALYELSKIDFTSITSLDDYNQKVEEVANTLINQYGYAQNEAIELAKKYAGQINSTTKELSTQESIIESIAKRTQKSVEEIQQWWNNLAEEDKQLILEGKVDFSYVFSTEAVEEEIDFVKNQFQSLDVSKLTSISGTLASGNKLKKDDNEILEELNASNPEAMSGFNEKSVLHQLDAIDEITQKRISANQEYLINLEEIIEKEINLREKEQKDIFETEEDYEEARKKLKDDSNLSEEEKKDIEERINKYQDLESEIINLNEIKEEGLSWEKIDTIGFDNLIAKIDMVINKADTLKSAAELIGEGFTVATSDVEKFAEMFPELLEGMEILSDGSMQLSKETVQNNIEGIKAELEARTQAQLAEIDLQIKLKELDKEFLEKKLKATENYLKGETDATTAINSIKAISQQYQEKLLDLTGEQVEELTNYSINASNLEAKGLLENLDQIGKAYALVSQAHYAMINGEEFDWTGISFSGNAVNAEAYASSIGGKAESQRAYAQEQYDAIYQSALETQAQLNKTNGELDELYAKRVVLESTSKASLNALDRVAAGKAGKEEKDKSGKDQKDKDKKEFEDEFNRYFDIEKAIEAVDYAVKILEKDQKNLHGKELIDSLKKENELIQEQTENYQKLYDLQVKEAKEVGGKLKGLGVEFDASGAITNYAEATTAALAEYNKAVDAYNAGILDDAGFEIAEKAYENFKKQLERYEALYYSEMRDTLDKIDDNNREVLENNLKSWETEIQVRLDMNELERDWKKFFKEINNDFKKVYKDLRKESKAIAEEAASYKSDVGIDLGAVNDIMAEIDKLQAGEQSERYQSVSQAQEDLKKFNDQLIDHASTLHNLVEQAWDTYLEGIDQASDKFDDLNDKFERVNDNLEFQGELIELMYGEKAYGLMKELYAGQEYSARNQIQSVQQQLDFWTKLYNETEEGDEDHLKAQEKMNEMQDKLNDLTIDYIKLLKDDYANSIDEILDTLDKKLTGGKGSEWLSEEWERVTEFSDTYFDNLEKGYHIQTLANKVEKDISKTYKDNLKAQQKLSKYQDQVIAKLKQEKNLRQEDLDIAQAKYDLLLKEIALEDARNNKTTMKLTRNEQGNWSYQYVADEEETENARQDKLDSNYNLYETASGAYNQVINEQLSAASDFTSKMKDLQMDESISQEEKNTRLGELRDQFLKESEIRQEKAQSYLDEIKIAGTALGIELYQQDQDAFTNLINNELQYFENFINTEKTDYLSLEQAFDTNCDNMNNMSKELMEATRDDWSFTANMLEELWNGDEESVRVSVNEAYESITEATNAYEDKIVELEELIGKKFHGPEGEECIVESIRKAERETDKLKEKTKELVVESGEMLTDLRKDLDNTTQEWNDMSAAIQNAINKLAAYMQMQGKSYTIPAPNINIDGLATNTGNVASSASKGKDYKKTAPPSPGGNDDNKYTYIVTDEAGSETVFGQTSDLQTAKNVIDYYRDIGFDGYIRQGEGDDAKYLKYDTGGYTGEWNGDNGRLALLHQKELVLNENDTKNLLDTVKLSRGIMDFVRQSVSNMFNSSMLRTSYNISGGTSPVQTDTGSTFYINSLEFPNANSVEEIKTAIMSLPNVASQYVNRNVK